MFANLNFIPQVSQRYEKDPQLVKHKFPSYYLELHQELFGGDFQNRVNFWETIYKLINI